jgi:hypothetical protein
VPKHRKLFVRAIIKPIELQCVKVEYEREEQTAGDNEIFTAVGIWVVVSWDITLCSLFYPEDGSDSFSEMLVSAYKPARHHHPEDHNSQQDKIQKIELKLLTSMTCIPFLFCLL